MSVIQHKGFKYVFDPQACNDCEGYCCFGDPGFVWINQDDIFRISSFLSMNVIDFIDQYLNLIDNRYTAKDIFTITGYYKCIFFDDYDRRCEIYDVRPSQCRLYPFWECFKQNMKLCFEECPGVKHLSCPDSI
jgi:hypothetical protein